MTALQQAAADLISRWHTPLWKDVPSTAEYIYKLQKELTKELNQSYDITSGAYSSDTSSQGDF